MIARKEDESPGFSDIFRGNSANCGLLLIELTPVDHAVLAVLPTGSTVTVDLPNQTVSFSDHSFHFDINEATKHALIEGLDLIGTTLRFNDAITAYEENSTAFVPAMAELSNA